MKKTLSSDDLLLVPQYSDIESRKEVDISVDLGDSRLLSSPIVAAPMDTICGTSLSQVREVPFSQWPFTANTIG